MTQSSTSAGVQAFTRTRTRKRRSASVRQSAALSVPMGVMLPVTLQMTGADFSGVECAPLDLLSPLLLLGDDLDGAGAECSGEAEKPEAGSKKVSGE